MATSTSTPTTAADKTAAPILETERLRLRPLAEADLSAIVLLANDRDVAEMTARIPHPYSLADARAWLAHLQAQDGRPGEPREIVFTIERRADRVVLGAIGLVIAEGGREAEIGFWLGKRFWNRDYMTEAASRVLRFGFEDLALAVVRGGALAHNAASLRVQEKLGMRHVGREVQPAPARGGDMEVVVLEIRREAWRG